MNRVRLANKIRSENVARSRANKLWPVLIERLQKFVGKKVIKVDGTPTSALLDELRSITEYERSGGDGLSIHCHHHRSKFDLCVAVESCAVQDSDVHYSTAYIIIGPVSDGNLESINAFKPRRDDYTVEGVEPLLEKARRQRRVPERDRRRKEQDSQTRRRQERRPRAT